MKSFNISTQKGLNRKELYSPLVLFSGGGKLGRAGKYWAIDLVLLLVAIAKTCICSQFCKCHVGFDAEHLFSQCIVGRFHFSP